MENIYQMTEKEYQHKKLRLASAREDLEQSLEDMKSARAAGDLSENSEYDAARDRYREIQSEIVQLSNELENCEIVHDDNSPVIKIGSHIAVTKLDDAGNIVGERREFTVAQKGDTVITKVIGVTSPLGKVILGKSSGVFDVVCNGKKRYKVEKILNEGN